MELATYGSLWHVVTTKSLATSEYVSIDPMVILCWMRDTASALSFMHKNQVIHKDIKAENILITHQLVAKVTDFGLAKQADIAGAGTVGGGTIGETRS